MARRGVLFPLLVVTVSVALGLLLSRNDPPPPTLVPADERPDFFLNDFTSTHYDELGERTAVMNGHSAEHFPNRNELEIEAPRWHLESHHGAVWSANAPRGTAQRGNHQMDLHGAVTLVRYAHLQRPRLEIETRDLHIDARSGEARTDAEVVAHDSLGTINGTGMTLDYHSDRLLLRHQARGRYVLQ